MSNRKVYHVTPDPDSGWKVKAENATRASSTHQKKDEAIDRAKELAKSENTGQVIIHKKDGTIQTEYTYGNDPYPPKGQFMLKLQLSTMQCSSNRFMANACFPS